jgi:PAS domain S-box-containing protein
MKEGSRGVESGEGLSVLLVEGDKSLCDSLAALLRVVDYEVVNVYSGLEAVAAVKAGEFDAAVIDVGLPDLGVVDLLRALREAGPDVGILMLSGTSTLDRAVESLNLGADSFIALPANPDALLSRLWRVARLKRLERRLMESEARYEELFEDVGEGVFHSDLKGNYTAMNRAGAEILGFNDPGEVLNGGLKAWETCLCRDEHEALIEKVLHDGEVRCVPRRFRRRDGTLGWLETTIRARRDSSGAVVGFDGVFRDLKDVVRYQEMLEALHCLWADLEEVGDVEEMWDLTLEFLRGAIDFDVGGFAVVDSGCIRQAGLAILDVVPHELSISDRCVTSRAVRTGEAQLVSDARESFDRAPMPFVGGEEVISVLAVPVKIGGEVVAVIDIGSMRPDAFEEEDVKLVEIVAGHVATVLDRLVLSRFGLRRDMKLKDFM